MNKNTFSVLFLLFILSCKKNSEIFPNVFPFGYTLSEFTVGEPIQFGGGDCWGTLITYKKDNTSMLADSSQCSEYSTSRTYYLLINDSIKIVHHQYFVTIYNESKQKPEYVATETVHDFTSNPASIFERTETLDQADAALFSSTFTKTPMDDVETTGQEFANRLEETRSLAIDTDDLTFTISTGQEKVDDMGVPSMDIFISSTAFEGPELLVNDYNVYPVEDAEMKSTYGIPANAKFSFYSWYAGGGACYYGVVQNRTLRVFRKYLEETGPDDEVPELQFELLKEFPLSGDLSAFSHYICYKGEGNNKLEIMIAFENDKAVSVRYKGQTESISLQFEKEEYHEGGAYPTIIEYYKELSGGKVNGTYKLTHAGNWDYAEYKRGKDGKVFNFVIDHETTIVGDTYSKTPCF